MIAAYSGARQTSKRALAVSAAGACAISLRLVQSGKKLSRGVIGIALHRGFLGMAYPRSVDNGPCQLV
jgi:hypothetical protein